MSDEIWVKVNCHHSGEFKREKDVLDYVDGVVDVVNVDSAATIFSNILLKLLEKKIDIGKMWWKLPFEDVEDKKPLWENVDVNKQKMSTAACWVKELDIYIEKSDVAENLNNEKDDEVYEPEGDISDNQEKGSEEALSDATDSDGDVEVAEEEIEVFDSNNYEEQIVDEDEVYPATDDSSGDEENHAEKLAKKDLPDGVFSLRQLFSSGTEFKKNVIKYVLKTRRNVVFNRWEKTKLEATCREKGCGWRIYCSLENPIGKWMVKVYEDEHQCHATGRCKLIKSPVIADIFLEDIRKDPEMSAPEIKDEMKKRFNIIISPPQSQTARRMTFDKLQAECDQQFARLRDYKLNLTKSNPDTTVEINTTRRADGSEAFSQIYICFEPLKSSWKKNCRPIIGLDGTFLKHSVQGMMLTAIGRDPNNQVYPIAWGVVDADGTFGPWF